jgi:hypothetical protein
VDPDHPTFAEATAMIPRCGEILHITRAASVQFAVPFYFRVIRVPEWHTYDGWLWVEGYQLDNRGDAVRKRMLFVQKSGLRLVTRPRPAPTPSLPVVRVRNTPRGTVGRLI